MANSDVGVLFCCFGIAAFIGIGLIGVLLPLSFHGLEHYEMGFRKQKSTGTVKREPVYESGLHLIGPDYEFVKFPADSQFVYLNKIKAFTSDRLEVKLSASFQYFLRSYELPLLHKQYNVDYEDIIRSKAVDALKGVVPSFNTQDIVNKRKKIEEQTYKAVRERLGGRCCAPDNYCTTWKYACPDNCKNRTLCEETDMGVYVDVKYFQLGQMKIPVAIEERFLTQLTLKEDSEREELNQEAQVTRKKTESSVKRMKNEAAEIREKAEANSRSLRVTSAANYTFQIEKARSVGLQNLYRSLGITQQEHKNSFDYLRTLRGLDSIWLTVDYDQKIVGNIGGR